MTTPHTKKYHALAQKYGTPLYVYDEKTLDRAVRTWQSALKSVDARIHYAMKANSTAGILSLFKSKQCGVDIVSGGELYRALRAGFHPSQVVFSGVGKTDDEISYALGCGDSLQAFQVECLEELPRIDALAGRLSRSLNKRVSARIGLRINPLIDAKTHPYISTGLHKNKFGLDPREFRIALEHVRCLHHLQLVGIGSHIGSQIRALQPLRQTYGFLLQLTREIEATGAFEQPLEFIDIGGGFAISYEGEKVPSIDDYARLILSELGRGKYSGQILLEPGRSLIADAGVLLTRAINIKKRKNRNFLVVDAGMTELIRPALYGSKHRIENLSAGSRPGTRTRFEVVGPVCESADFLGHEVPLPADTRPGDLLAVFTAGAYASTMSSTYNSRPRAAEILIRGKKDLLLTRREQWADLVIRENI